MDKQNPNPFKLIFLPLVWLNTKKLTFPFPRRINRSLRSSDADPGRWRVESGLERNSQSFPQDTRITQTESHWKRFLFYVLRNVPFLSFLLKRRKPAARAPSLLRPCSKGECPAAIGFILFFVFVLPNCLKHST